MMVLVASVLDVITTRDVLQWALAIIGTLFGVMMFLLKLQIDSLREEIQELRRWRHDIQAEAHRQLWMNTYGKEG